LHRKRFSPDHEDTSMSSTTESSEHRRIDTTMMYAVHDAFQRDLDRITSLAERGVTPGSAVHVGWDRFKAYLHVHHTAEDTHLWPVLRAKVAGRPADLALLEEMENEHTGLTALLDAVDAALTSSAPPHRLAVHAQRLSHALTAHCDHEEDMALPLVTELLTEREWAAFGAEQRRQLGRSGAASFFPWLLDGAPDHTQRKLLAILPPPVRFIYRAWWRPRYFRDRHWEAPTHA
jgi:hemerythrin-like domain-containing protein